MSEAQQPRHIIEDSIQKSEPEVKHWLRHRYGMYSAQQLPDEGLREPVGRCVGLPPVHALRAQPALIHSVLQLDARAAMLLVSNQPRTTCYFLHPNLKAIRPTCTRPRTPTILPSFTPISQAQPLLHNMQHDCTHLQQIASEVNAICVHQWLKLKTDYNM